MMVYLSGITAIGGGEGENLAIGRSMPTRRSGSQLWGITEARGVAMLVLRSESLLYNYFHFAHNLKPFIILLSHSPKVPFPIQGPKSDTTVVQIVFLKDQ